MTEVTTAIFSILDGALLRPLPYRDPDRLAFSWTKLAWIGVPRAWMNGSNVAVLGHAAWLRYVSADPEVVGRTIEVSGTPVRVIGHASALSIPRAFESRSSRRAGRVDAWRLEPARDA